MARKSHSAAPLYSTHGEAPIREFLNSDLTPGQSKQRAAAFINSGELLRNLRSLTLENQTKFIDKVDQACRDGVIPLVQRLLTLYYIYKGASNFRFPKRKANNCLGECMQRNSTTSDFGSALYRARET